MTDSEVPMEKQETEKPYYVVTFHSTSEAMKAEKAVGDIGKIIPVPSEISAGCGFAIKLSSISPGLALIEGAVETAGLFSVQGRGKCKIIKSLRQ